MTAATIMITGAAGQLGFELQRTAPVGTRLLPVDIAELDLTDRNAVESFVLEHRPAVIINAAAYTAVDRAEDEPTKAEAVNAAAARNLAEFAKRHGARMIQLSTDFVFGGPTSRPWAPTDATQPESVYGRTKRDGELAVLETLGADALVIRTAWLYSVHGTNFVKTMLRLMRERESIGVVVDQIGTPTWAHPLAEVVWEAVARRDVSGCLHWTDAGVASWYDFAVAIQEEALEAGLLSRQIPIMPIATSDYPTPARRPAFSVLDKRDAIATLRVTPRHWRVCLRQMLHELKHA